LKGDQPVKFLKSFLICLLALMLVLALPVSATNTAYSWYCRHVDGHVQPRADAALAFVEELDGYYIDHRHSDPNDADKVVYLTFDAGYENGNVAKILDVLKEEQVPAAFFILGGLIKRAPELVLRMKEEGHLICNHTNRHRDMSGFGDSDFFAELESLETLYKDLTGERLAPYYRPPEGRFSRDNLACAQKNGYKTIFWSFAYPDWDNHKQPDIARASETILKNAHNGEVMLLHPTSAMNAAILRDVIAALRAEGYRFGTLDELTASDD
jgi:peptidoglycan-N-acetylmuramic acid deacetylase